MHIIAKRTLREYWLRHPASKGPLEAWYSEVKNADWQNFAEIKATYRNASGVGNNRVVFNIKGKYYRLVVRINYESQTIFIRFMGTHKKYDKIDSIENI